MSNLKNHAMKEFEIAGWCDSKGDFNCGMQGLMCKQVIELLELFSSHGHSGSTAPYAANLFKSLAMFETITPLTGGDDEWNDVGGGVKQNKRLGSVFMGEDGKAYDIDGRVFWEWYKSDDGEMSKSTYTNLESRLYIDFPYEQKKPEMVFVPTEDFPNEKL